MLKEEEIERIIYDEILVDCYNDEDAISMSWCYYMQETLEFPFKAKARLKKRDGSIELKQVKVLALASKEEDFKGKDFDLEVENGEYLQKIKYSELTNIKASDETMEAFEIWDYWIGKR